MQIKKSLSEKIAELDSLKNDHFHELNNLIEIIDDRKTIDNSESHNKAIKLNIYIEKVEALWNEEPLNQFNPILKRHRNIIIENAAEWSNIFNEAKTKETLSEKEKKQFSKNIKKRFKKSNFINYPEIRKFLLYSGEEA